MYAAGGSGLGCAIYSIYYYILHTHHITKLAIYSIYTLLYTTYTGGSGLGCASLYPQWELLTEKMTSRLGNGSEREEREREEEGVAFGLLSEAAPGEDAHLNLSHVSPY